MVPLPASVAVAVEGASGGSMKSALITAICMSIGCTLPAKAETGYLVWGVGNDSCGSYVQQYPSQSNVHYMQSSWVQGFVTAKNEEIIANARKRIGGKAAAGFDLLRNADTAGLQVWLFNYCQSHPLEPLSHAASEFVNELVNRCIGNVESCR
jgi:hypothetical protein